MKIFHNPSISLLKFSRTTGLLAIIFRGPSLYEMWWQISEQHITFSDNKWRKKNKEKSGSQRFMKIFINDTLRRKLRMYKDHRRKTFLFQIAQISFAVFIAPYSDLIYLVAPLSQPKTFGGPFQYFPAPYPASLMTGPLDSSQLQKVQTTWLDYLTKTVSSK